MFFSSFKKFFNLILILPFVFINSKDFFCDQNAFDFRNEQTLNSKLDLNQEIVQNPTINLFDYAGISGGDLEETLYSFTLFNVNQYQNFQSINFILKNPDNYQDTFTISIDGTNQSTTINELIDNDYVLDLATLFPGFDFTKKYDYSNKPIIIITLTTNDMQTVKISFDYFTTSYEPVLSPLKYEIIDNQIQLSIDITYDQDIIDFYLFENGVDITFDDRVDVISIPIDSLTSRFTFTVDYGEDFSQMKSVNFVIKVTWNDGYNWIDQIVTSNILDIDLQKKSPIHDNLAIIIGSSLAAILLIVIAIVSLVLFKRSKNKSKA